MSTKTGRGAAVKELAVTIKEYVYVDGLRGKRKAILQSLLDYDRDGRRSRRSWKTFRRTKWRKVSGS